MGIRSPRAGRATRTTEAPVLPSLTDLRLALRSLLRAPTLFAAGALTLDDEPHVIVGILPKGAALPRLERVQAWQPIHFDPRSEERRDWRGFLAYGHVRDGASLDAVRAEMAAWRFAGARAGGLRHSVAGPCLERGLLC